MPSASLIPSYGRRRGRKLKEAQASLVSETLPALRLHLSESGLDPATLFGNSHPLWLEIGFGGGEHLAAQASRHPSVNFIGCETYVNGMASLLRQVKAQRLANIRVFGEDARLLVDALPASSLARVLILFPDPWPKARHHKRRLVTQSFLAALSRAMQAGALLRLATDHADYGSWMLEQLLACEDFQWLAKDKGDWLNPAPDWVPTRYEQKAHAQGRRSLYLDFHKA